MTAKTRTTQYGQWTWNEELFRSKIGTQDEQGCISWLGSTGPHCGLFGAVKNGKPQMTQARRILLMSEGLPDIENKAIRMRCNNTYCMNPMHMFLEENKRKNIRVSKHVKRGFVETRIGLYRWEMLSPREQTVLKNLAATYRAEVSFNHELEYYKIIWTRHYWLMACLKEPDITSKLTQVYRRAD